MLQCSVLRTQKQTKAGNPRTKYLFIRCAQGKTETGPLEQKNTWSSQYSKTLSQGQVPLGISDNVNTNSSEEMRQPLCRWGKNKWSSYWYQLEMSLNQLLTGWSLWDFIQIEFYKRKHTVLVPIMTVWFLLSLKKIGLLQIDSKLKFHKAVESCRSSRNPSIWLAWCRYIFNCIMYDTLTLNVCKNTWKRIDQRKTKRKTKLKHRISKADYRYIYIQ